MWRLWRLLFGGDWVNVDCQEKWQPDAPAAPAASSDTAAVLAKLASVMSPEELANVARKLMQ